MKLNKVRELASACESMRWDVEIGRHWHYADKAKAVIAAYEEVESKPTQETLNAMALYESASVVCRRSNIPARVMQCLSDARDAALCEYAACVVREFYAEEPQRCATAMCQNQAASGDDGLCLDCEVAKANPEDPEPIATSATEPPLNGEVQPRPVQWCTDAEEVA